MDLRTLLDRLFAAGAEPAGPGGGARRAVLHAGAAWGVAAALAATDYVSAVPFDVSLTYAFPVAWASWWASGRAGAALAVACAIVDTAVDVHLRRYGSGFGFVAWNVVLQFLLLLFASSIVARLRRDAQAERALSRRLDLAHRTLDEEIQRVGAIQVSLLPQAVPSIPGWDVAVHYAPSLRAGGDYYDFFPLPDARLGVLIADASGHGPSAAVLMTMMRVIAHADRGAQSSPGAFLAAVNARLVENILLTHFVTACYAVLDPRTGRLEYSLAGHPLPVARRGATGRAAEVGHAAGPPLGLDASARYARQEASLAPGDALVLYTDGLTEARDPSGELLGDEAVLAGIAEGDGAAGSVVERLLRRLAAHLRGRAAEDDVTILVLSSTATGSSAPR